MTLTTKARKTPPRRRTGARKTPSPKPPEIAWETMTVDQKLDCLAWTQAELLWSVKVELAKLALQNPAMQQAVAERIARGQG